MSGSPKDQCPYAIVIGLNGMNGIQTARILADRGVPVIAIAKDPKHYGCYTKVCEKILFADTGTEAFIDELVALGEIQMISKDMVKKDKGLAVKINKVFMLPGTYPRIEKA